MFLLAVTKDEIAQNFKSVKVEEFSVHSFKVTIITDKFLSNFISEPNGFSVIESPLINTPDFQNVIFSKVTYDSTDDRFSIFKSTISGRPMYYHINQEGEFFCSTHISLLRSAGVPIEENISVLPEFFVFRFVMPPNTLYKNIYQLLIGGQLKIEMVNSKCVIKSINRYNPPQQDKKIRSIAESSLKLYNYLSESIKKLDIRKDKTTVLLSGGIDSSVLSSICKVNSITKTSYSTGYPFEDPAMNVEKNYALSAAQALGTTHQYYEPTIDEYLVGFLESIKHVEEPLHHLQSVILHLLFKNCLPVNKKIVIMGQGAGFSFGNFHNYLYWKDKMITKILKKKPIRYSLFVGSK